LFQKDGDLMPVGCGPVVQVNHAPGSLAISAVNCKLNPFPIRASGAGQPHDCGRLALRPAPLHLSWTVTSMHVAQRVRKAIDSSAKRLASSMPLTNGSRASRRWRLSHSPTLFIPLAFFQLVLSFGAALRFACRSLVAQRLLARGAQYLRSV